MPEQDAQIKQFQTAIAQLEAQRAIVGDAVVDASILALREKLAALSSSPQEKGAVELHGERRQATILIADVKGSTELAEQVDIETWVEIMNRVFHLLGDVIYRYGGEIDQYRGDGLVAFFGAKAAHEDDPERTVRAALAMQEAVKRYATELEAERGVELLLRIGINTGEVIAAEVGDRRQHSEDTAMGRAIALAARMESAAQPGTVLVTANTYRLTRTLFEWLPLGEISVKNVSQPVTVYRPLVARAITGKGRGIEGLSSPLVGRDAEFQALQNAIVRLRSGVGGIVTLVGEAGIGKSRLVAELRAQSLTADVQPSTLRWVEGRCLSYTTGVAYSLWLALLRELLGVALDASLASAREALQVWLHAVCPDCLDDIYPFLGRLLSLPLEEEAQARLCGIEAEGLMVLTYRAIETLLERVARQQPVVLVCEDLHWADPTSLELLAYVLSLTDRVPLLLVFVLRPETAHGCWQLREAVARDYRHRHLDLWLAPLSRADEASLVANLLRVEDLPLALRERILERAEGNPFYVEEILRSLIDSGVVTYEKDTGHWRAVREVTDIPISDTLRGVLASRIDRLPAETKRVLQAASVIGRIFSRPVLAAIAEEQGLDHHLLTLQRAQMVRERARLPEQEYVFEHYLTVEAAYDSLLRRECRACHRQVAEALERLYPERLDEQVGLLAHHWERAEANERAVQYLERAGQQAAAQYANKEAVSFFSRALALVPGTEVEKRYKLLLAREAVYDLQGNREAQWEDLVELKQIVIALGDDQRSAEVALRESNYARQVGGDQTTAVAAAQEAIRYARRAGDVASVAEGHLLWGKAIDTQGQTSILDVIPIYKEALQLSRAARLGALEADCLRELGLIAADWQGDWVAGRGYYEQSLHIYRESGNRMGEGQALNTLCIVYRQMGDYATAKEYGELGLQLCRETGNRIDEAWGLQHLGSVSHAQADYSAAYAYYERSLHIFRDTGTWFGEDHSLGCIGQLCDELGDYVRARAYSEQLLDSIGATLESKGWRGHRGRLYHHLGRDEDAHELCRQAVLEYRIDGYRPGEAQALTYLGHALVGLGRLDEAAGAYRQALSLQRELDAQNLAMEPLAGLARVAMAQGDVAQASSHVKEILTHLASHPELYGTSEPLRVYLTCYRVLSASGDPRAEEILSNAHRMLQERAARIKDEALRGSYLENVAVHREIIAEWNIRRHQA